MAVGGEDMEGRRGGEGWEEGKVECKVLKPCAMNSRVLFRKYPTQAILVQLKLFKAHTNVVTFPMLPERETIDSLRKISYLTVTVQFNIHFRRQGALR